MLEREGAGANLVISLIERIGCITFAGGLVGGAAVAKHVRQGKVREGAVRMAVDERLGILIGLDHVAALDAVRDQPGGREDVIRVERKGALQGSIRLVEQRLALLRLIQSTVGSLVVVALPQRRPGWRVTRIESDGTLEHG